MMLRMELFRTSVFWKMFVGFVAVVIPFFIVGILAIPYGSRIITKDLENANGERQQLFLKYFDEQLHNVSQMLVSLSTDTDIVSFYSRNQEKISVEEVFLIESISSKLKMIFYSSELIDDVYLIFPDADRQISVLEGYSHMNEKNQAFIKDHTVRQMGIYPRMAGDTLTFSMAFSDPIMQSVKVNYMLGVDISSERVYDSLQTFQNNKIMHIILIENKSGQPIGGKLLDNTDHEILKYVKGMAPQTKFKRVSVMKESFLVQSGVSGDGNFTLISYVPEDEVYHSLHLFRDLLSLVLILSLCLFFLLALMIYRQIHLPLRALVRTMREVERGQLNIVYKPVGTEFGYVYRQFDHMLSKLRALIQDVLEKQIQVQRAELKQLQSKINPHFLFNCFYIGYRMAKSGENENVAKLCKYLGDYFRFVTHFSDKEISLQDELKYVTIYLEIQMLRFSNRLTYHMEVEPSVRQVMIPCLLLQPLVENSIIHGLEQVQRPTHIAITVQADNTQIRIIVRDNGKGMSPDSFKALQASLKNTANDSEHYGLWNVNWRLSHQYGKPGELHLENSPDHGFAVSFMIPMPGQTD